MDSLILIKKNYDLMTNTEKIIADYISVSYTHLDVYKRQR